jgi:hypothetical protein
VGHVSQALRNYIESILLGKAEVSKSYQQHIAPNSAPKAQLVQQNQANTKSSAATCHAAADLLPVCGPSAVTQVSVS